MFKNHYVYRISNLIENKHYYGVRTTDVEPHLDIGVNYFSSSSDKVFIKDQKQNPQNYKYKVVRVFGDRNTAIKFERFLHLKFNVSTNESFYNKVIACEKTFTWSDEYKKLFSDKMKGKKNSLGVKHSEETRRRMSESRKGEKHFNFGGTISDIQKQQISKANSKKMILEDNFGNEIKVTKSYSEMALYFKENKIPLSMISRYLGKEFKSKRNPHLNGWVCRYV
jgi:hypothetical protein